MIDDKSSSDDDCMLRRSDDIISEKLQKSLDRRENAQAMHQSNITYMARGDFDTMS